MKNIAAFFDIDGTIFRNSLLIEHFKSLITYKFLSYDAWSILVEERFNNWSKREGDYEEYLYPLTEHYVNGLKRISPADVNFVAKRVIDLKGDNVYKYTKERIKFHREKGHKIVIISGSPDFLVSKMANKLRIDYYYATKYVVEDNRYTGEVIPMWDSNSKKKAIDSFCKEYNIDLENSYAYGDTTGDYSMFNMVGNPIAINPAKKLLNKIIETKELANRIQIKVERKDVIYTLNANDIEYNREEEINDTNK